MRVSLCALVAAAALLAPAHALADSVSITPPADPVATVETTMSVQVTTDRTDYRLELVSRPVAEGPCAATPFADYEQGDPTTRSYPTDKQPPPSPIKSGTYHFRHTWDDLGAQRICAWIAKPTSTPYEDVTAADSKDVDVRAPRGTMRVSRVRAEAVRQDGSYLTARLSGTIEGTANIEGTVVAAGKRCPADPDDGRVALRVDDPLVEGGAFARGAATSGPLPFGRWRVCAYARHHLGTATAAASAVYQHRVKPTLIEKPDIGSDLNTRWLTCRPGEWAAYPKKLRFSFQWYRDGRKVRGARKQRYNAKRHGYYTCGVTARNRVGRTTARSYGHNILKV
jgi:hypothetical protein